MMKDDLQRATEKAETLDEILHRVLAVFRAYDPAGPFKKFRYVSGVITSHGDMAENCARMAHRTEMIKKLFRETVFAPT